MLAVIILNCAIVAVTVLLHYEFLYQLTRFIPKLHIKHRYRIVVGVFISLTAHVLEVWIFALAYYWMNKADGWGELTGAFNGSLLDCAYYSFVSYTTLGLGDIEPSGSIRYLTGIESLTGLVLITWTASFLYLEMQRHWDAR